MVTNICFLMTLIAVLFFPASRASAVDAPLPAITGHSGLPPYSGYNFGVSPKVIDFGTQPLSVPTGVIGEVMKRDRILRAAFRAKGFEIRFHPFLKGNDINTYFRLGKIDAAMVGDMPVLVIASGSDVRVAALARQGFSSIVTKGNMPIEGLRGKRIGYPPVSNAHFALLAALSSADLRESDVRLVPMDINGMIDALAGGRIDAFAAFEPAPSIALKKIDEAAISYRYLNSSYLYFSAALSNRYPEAASQVIASMVRALSWLRKREEHLLTAAGWVLAEQKRVQGKETELSAGEIADLTVRDLLGIVSAPVIPEKDLAPNGSIRKKFDFLKRAGKIAPATPWMKIMESFDRTAVREVLANPQRYRLNSFDYDMGAPGR